MTVQAFVGMGLDQGAQRVLDELLAPTGARSVKTAIEADKTLGGVVKDVWVSAMTGYNVVLLSGGQQQVFSADWSVQVTS